MSLPEELEKQFQMELKTFEEARQMKYVTTIERMAEERGEARGEVRGAKSREAEIALNMLKDNLSIEQITRLTGLTISEVEGFANEQVQELQSQASK
jgi:predicted transposase/invertase (TIGR01784 family)